MVKEKTKKVAMVIAFRDFRDAEYFVPKEVLEKGGIEVKTASNKLGIAIGADGGEANVDLLVSQINVDDFDSIVFVGGPGCPKYLDNEETHKIAKEAIEKNKILAAICIAPTVLSKSGIFQGKKVTGWTDAFRTQRKILEKNGAIFVDEPVVVDGNIVTANGPKSAKEFGEKILELLTKE
jgi:protease I